MLKDNIKAIRKSKGLSQFPRIEGTRKEQGVAKGFDFPENRHGKIARIIAKRNEKVALVVTRGENLKDILSDGAAEGVAGKLNQNGFRRDSGASVKKGKDEGIRFGNASVDGSADRRNGIEQSQRIQNVVCRWGNRKRFLNGRVFPKQGIENRNLQIPFNGNI